VRQAERKQDASDHDNRADVEFRGAGQTGHQCTRLATSTRLGAQSSLSTDQST
jgi:hypothetical protein